jgi:hypothetical protein
VFYCYCRQIFPCYRTMQTSIEPGLGYVAFLFFTFIGEGNRRTRRKPLYHIMLYTSPWARFELTTSVVIGTDCIGSCKSNYHTITTTTAPCLGLGNVFHLICHLQQYFSHISLVSVFIEGNRSFRGKLPTWRKSLTYFKVASSKQRQRAATHNLSGDRRHKTGRC